MGSTSRFGSGVPSVNLEAPEHVAGIDLSAAFPHAPTAQGYSGQRQGGVPSAFVTSPESFDKGQGFHPETSAPATGSSQEI